VSSSSSVLLSSLELSDTKVYEPYIRALLGTASHFCEVVVLKLRTVPTKERGFDRHACVFVWGGQRREGVAVNAVRGVGVSNNIRILKYTR